MSWFVSCRKEMDEDVGLAKSKYRSSIKRLSKGEIFF